MIALFSTISIVIFSSMVSTGTSFAVSDRDYDHDGILDEFDECPLRSETYNKFEDFDGCPDSVSEELIQFKAPDIDKDGVEDRLDSCPYEPENFNEYLDDDGCPEIVPDTINVVNDSDFDTITDAFDSCPTEKEIFNGLKDDDGCPDSWDSAIIEDMRNSVNLDNQCRPGKVLVIRLNANDSICVTLETAKKWETYGIIKSLDLPPTEVPPTEVPPTEVPPTEVPPTEVPQDPITPPLIQDEKMPLPENIIKFNLTDIIQKTDSSFEIRSDKEKRNIETIIIFLSALSPWDQKIVAGLLADDYVEHDPAMPGTRQGFLDNLDQIFTGIPPKVIKYDLKRIYADNDYVITHSHYQDIPELDASLIDIFKINEDGRIIEHWDVIQEIPDTSLNGNTIFYLD
jgi:predicted SnoaL-like aldol condensation-catalyzing enzyme